MMMSSFLLLFQSSMAPKTTPDADSLLKAFISRDPTASYTFDSERDAPTSEICRELPNKQAQRECIAIQMHSKRLFEAMQDLDFFCALPTNPEKTYMECTPISK
ncbi:hypothetical protein FB45DRAFT_1057334 [Roridomyces roridus]|uniref:Uncharacterized protein n=1 Tax=Roridomyces roridus TaxID=1738132 RepID=A0AAD7BVN3_9AGAR|nr:hypothetical protein FB45DRAFT_1057334 [Roridomyces roridus]